ncbi:MAG: ATP-binding protein [Rhodocyclaceae bacterium]|nr:ATP-binding protein [Rhodocyclaceae bacterium]
MSEQEAFSALFAPETPPPTEAAPTLPWKVLLVDDEPDIHAVLRLALQDIEVACRPLCIMDAHSADEAGILLAQHPDIALVLLDVVMETERAGLELVHHIRRDLLNPMVQIILITGQPGYAPQREVVANYEINGYRLKSELTADKIFSSVHSALRTHQYMGEGELRRRRLEAQAETLASQQQALAQYQHRLEELVAERTAELAQSNAHLAETQFAMDRAGIAIAWNDVNTGRFLYVNDEACRQLGYDREALLGLCISDINPEFPPEAVREVARSLRERGASHQFETLHRRKDGSLYPAEVTAYVRRAPEQDCFIAFFSNITERKKAEAEARTRMEELTRGNRALAELNVKLTQAQDQLVQSEKLASIGLLAAGVAHEINNPIGYVKSNMCSLVRYIDDFLRVLNAYEQVESLLPEHTDSFSELHHLEQQISFEYEREDIRGLVAESLHGLERVTKIVQDLKDFSRVESEENWMLDDIHGGIESTLNVVWNQLKYTCEVRKEFETLPRIECLLSQLNQVFMNLLVNAAQAIETRGIITLRTGIQGEEIWVEVSDTGKGMAPESIKRIFDPFYTTKPVGAGTGLGLAVSYSIVQKHHGRIEVESALGKGSTFRVWLPLRQPDPNSQGLDSGKPQ